MTSTHSIARTDLTIARTLSGQIPGWLKMALGFRNAVALPDGLQFDVTAGKTYRVVITLNALDLYEVRILKIGRRSKTNPFPIPQTVAEYLNVYADQMVEILDRLDRGRLEMGSI